METQLVTRGALLTAQDDGAEPPGGRDEDSGPPRRGGLRQQEPLRLSDGLGLPARQLEHPNQEVGVLKLLTCGF